MILNLFAKSNVLKIKNTLTWTRHLVNTGAYMSLGNPARMKWVLVYKGKGMFEEDTRILTKLMKEHVDAFKYQVDTVSAMEIINGRLEKGTVLLVIGGGYDLGLIEALGPRGMANIREYVETGGKYLGICSGAYFACERIEFDKGGPLEVLGERFLKFYPGIGIGPLFKAYDYRSRQGACAVNIDFKCTNQTGNQDIQNKHCDARDRQLGCSEWRGTRIEDCKCGRKQSDIANGLCLCGLDSKIASVTSRMDKVQSFESQIPVHDNKSQFLLMGSQKQSKISGNESHCLKFDEKSHYPRCFKESQFNGIDICSEVTTGNNEIKQMCHKIDSSLDKPEMKNKLDLSCKVYFNGGCYFKANEQNHFDNVKVLSRYLDEPECPPAIVHCQVGEGMVVLSGPHFEYDAWDIDDGDITVTDIIPCLMDSSSQRKLILRSILQHLNISTT